MNISNSTYKDVSKERIWLRTTCLLGGILSPIITIVWAIAYPATAVNILQCIFFSVLFFSIYILTYKNDFIRRHAYHSLYIVCFVSTIWIIALAYMKNFEDPYIWLLVVVIFEAILVMKKTSHMIFYFIIMLSLTICALFMLKEPSVNRENTTGILIIFCIVGYIHMKSKLDTQKELLEAESLYRSLVESALVGVYLYQDQNITYVNPYIQRVLGYTIEEFNKMKFQDIVYYEDREKLSIESSQNQHETQISQFRVVTKEGNIINAETHATSINYNGKDTVVGTLLDISHLKKAEDKIKHIAYHDELTGLTNRYVLNDYLNHKLSLSDRNSTKLGVMFIDLDRFKVINDTLGHSFGDLILQLASDRLSKCIRKDDIISRYGGDEFVIILQDMDYNSSALMAQKIISVFGPPFIVDNHEVYTTPSIGISFYPQDGDNVEALIKNADAAMYLAKERGRNGYQFFTTNLNEIISKKMEMENGLRNALINKEFILHYQPQFSLYSEEISGTEALIRWLHPVLGLVPPLEFIPLAEETGLIIPIGLWVLETACKQNKAWQDSGYSSIPVAVNVSVYQLQNSDFVQAVKDVLDKTKLEPQYLIIEITESVLQDTQRMYNIVKELKSIGVKVAIDDFGTGYSSLSILKNLTIDILKIDPSFISDFNTNRSSLTLTKLIIDMGHELHYDIIAEGIENQQNAQILKLNNCDIGQGYFFSRPVLSEEVEEIFKRASESQEQ